MKILRIDYDEKTRFAKLFGPFTPRFNAFLKSGIKPMSYRRFNGKQWEVHDTKLPLLVSVARRHFDHVDYRSLPEEIQILIASKSSNGSGTSEVDLGPHATLHLLPSAPWEVIKASYRALSLKCHPDHGGDAEQFRKIHSAYEALKDEYESS